MNKKTFLVVGILIIAAFFRLYNLTVLPPGLYPDEAMNGNNALEAISTGQFKIFYPENNGREGLFMNIQAGFLKVLMPIFNNTPEPWMLRLASAFFGILTVLGVYFLAKELFNKKVGLLSSFLIATNFWHINFSRIGFRAIMAPFFLVWAVYFLLISLKKSLSATSYKLTAVIGGIIFGLGFYSYIAYRVMPILMAMIFFYYLYQHREHAKKLWAALGFYVIATFIVALPIGIYFLKNPADFMGRTTQVSVGVSQSPLKDLAINTVKTLGMFNFIGDENWRHNIANAPELFWPVGILLIIGIILGLFAIFKNSKHEARNSKQCQNLNDQNLSLRDISRRETKRLKIFNFGNSDLFRISDFGFRILFGWFALAMLPVVISDEGIPHALRSILLIPPAIIFAGFAGVWIYDWILERNFLNDPPMKKLANIFVSIFFLILIYQAYYAYFIQWGQNPNIQGAFAADYVQIGKELNALPKDMPKYVIVQAGGVAVRGIPMPTQTVMYITDTFTSDKQKTKNIFYILPDQISKIPAGAYTVTIK